ncbi:MAG: hypothetical protein J0I20_22645 [Chloroflexi bacterium]|nr:hypothetical protein [Chloroflexota bacterium]OJV92984.1 MAG: hypothetical protein BGO39_20930 [Chloroflexi bacterium 54-19]
MSKDLAALPTVIITLSWVLFLIWRIIKVPDRVTNRSIRYLTYIGVLVPLCLITGIVGTVWRNNWIYYCASITTQAVIYCFLAWYSLNFYMNSAKSNKFFVRPISALGLAFTMVFELICFSLAGPVAFDTVSMAQPLELNQSLWLMLGVASTMVYLLVNSLVLTQELKMGMDQGASPVFRYRCFSFLFISTLYSIWASVALSGLLFYYFSGIRVIEDFASAICFLVLLILGVIYAIVLILDKKAFIIYESKIEPFFNRRKIRKLQWLYQHLLNLFPSETYTNPFNYADVTRETSPGWMLKVIVHELINFRILVLSTHSLLAAGTPLDLTINPEKELPLWNDFIGTPDKIEVAKALSHKISPVAVAPAKSKAISIEQETAFFLWLADQLKKKFKGEYAAH